MNVCGKFVKTFAEASHALPTKMHMNADYPFMIPAIVSIDGSVVTIGGHHGETTTFRIEKMPSGELGHIAQSSSFETLFNRRPQRFELRPFRDDRLPAIGTKGTTV